ncbi:MAG: four-helix bundle copper-binding protein [Nitrococcus sp.]|nr:four-helix bundle copper-binding protein [Nitrococcus sp.]
MNDEMVTPTPSPGLSRRNFLAASAAGATLFASGVGSAQASHDMQGMHGEHGKHGTLQSPLTDALSSCVAVGTRCVNHCLMAFKEGDTELADCAASVADMVPVCEAMYQLTLASSTHAAAMGKVCKAICEDCEDACRKHEDKHEVCRECADACAAVVKQLKTA